ncbi:MAG: type II methionyl aminopeptidase [archaeon]
MDSEERDKLLKAGKIAREVLEFVKLGAKPGVKLLDLANKADGKIFALDGRPAFPINLSLNHIAAHYTPGIDDETVFTDNDILKIDVGVHVDGFIADTACTVGFDKELIKASEEALKAAIKVCRPGVKVSEIGREVEEVITSYEGYTPIRNLNGHSLAQYELHSGITIPNFDDSSQTVLNDGDVIAIEPFATTGVGRVKTGKPSGIFRLECIRPIRSMEARKLMKFIESKYRSLPFARRWIASMPANLLNLNILEREEVLHQYPELPEESKGLVSQAEHTVIIGDKPVVTTRD